MIVVQLYVFLATIVDAAVLVAQAFVIGGAVFAALVAGPLGEQKLLERSLGWLTTGGLVLVLAEFIATAPPVMELVHAMGIPTDVALGADFVTWHAVAAVCGLGIAVLSKGPARKSPALLLVPVAIILLAGVMTSHAASRVENRFLIGIAHVAHTTAASVWIGGIPFLIMAVTGKRGLSADARVTQRYSAMAIACVALLLPSAAVLTGAHVDTAMAFIGGEYGALVLVKMVLLGILLLFGLHNLRAGQAMAGAGAGAGEGARFRLGRYCEAELGLAVAAFLVAASLGSQPPPVDLANELVTPAQLWSRLVPTWPRLVDTPVFSDEAWSEVNHNWAGVLLTLMGGLALLAHSGKAAWAKHWPLLFFVMTVGLVLRSDPDSWPIGPNGFRGRGGGDPEVIQHRLLVLLPAWFGVMEWKVQTGRAKRDWHKKIFPLCCAVGGALLFAHNHQIGDVKDRFLIEFSHLPMGLLGMVAGWSRWLELRADPKTARFAGWIWPACLLVIGLLLADYKEIPR